MPLVSVILNTYNRSELVPRAIESVCSQSFSDWELIVVDDGSTDDTRSVMASLTDRRIRCIRHPNMGLTASRNAGATLATGDWIAFLDDDDTVEPEWLSELVSKAGDGIGIVFCGFKQVTLQDRELSSHPPERMSLALGGACGSILPGTWLMRRSLFQECGGYLDGLPYSHQFELLIRALACARATGLRPASIDDSLFRYTARESSDRPMMWPGYACDGARWILARHPAHFGQDRHMRANYHGIIGVASARLGRHDLSRRHFWRAIRAEPLAPKRWLRIVTGTVPAIGRRVWGVSPDRPRSRTPPLIAVHELPAERYRPEEHYFLPWGYARNPQASADAAGTPYWAEPSLNSVLYQEPVYRAARRLVKKRGLQTVLDVGTGSGVKLERYLMDAADRVVGLDQGSAIEIARERCDGITWIDGDLMDSSTWEQLDLEPDLIVCADVVEHVEDPVRLLRGIRRTLKPGARLLVSTPDRLRFDRPDQLGPPGNPRHVREWTTDEFELFLESCGLEIESRHRYLPRGYRLTILEAKRQVWRLLHLRRLPDRRSNAAWICYAGPTQIGDCSSSTAR